MKKYLLLTCLAIPSACDSLPNPSQTPEEHEVSCAAAREKLSAAEALATVVNLTPEHQLWAEMAATAAHMLVQQVCPAPLVPPVVVPNA